MPLTNSDRALIQQLVQSRATGENADLVEDIIETALRLADDKAGRLDIKVINSALRELRYAAKVFTPYRDKRKVTVFGSARTNPEAPEYRQAEAFGKAIVERGYMVITGGGEGIMGAAQRGAGREHSFGLNIRLPFEQTPNVEIAGDVLLNAGFTSLGYVSLWGTKIGRDLDCSTATFIGPSSVAAGRSSAARRSECELPSPPTV